MEVADLTNLIQRAQRQDPAAYDALIDLYADRLYGFLYRVTGSRADAEDLLQELFLRVVRTLPLYRHGGAFEGWLFRIATNLARDSIRRARRAPPTLPGGWQSAPPGSPGSGTHDPADGSAPAPDHRLRLREDTDALQQALAMIPGAEREVVMLRHFSDMTFAEIAELMGTPLGTALARGHRGLAKLREILGAEDDA